MPRDSRKQLIARLEQLRNSRVITYITGDRHPAAAQIGDDAIRPLYDQLRSIGHAAQIDLFIYSRGGAIDVPWRIASALREACDQWHMLVPFRANSAATLIGLGADQIVFGRHGELGPIDPIMNIERIIKQPAGGHTTVQETINVEDLLSYVRFVKERAGLSDQTSLTSSLAKLTDRLDAVSLGSAYRTHSHIRDVARRMLASRKESLGQQAVDTIVETLAEKVYAHGHAISRADAEKVGLPVTAAGVEVEAALWDLWVEYERDLKIREPIDPAVAVEGTDVYREEATIAVIETTDAAYEFRGEIEIRARRQIPANLNVAMNVNLQLPPNLQPAQAGQLQAAFQQMLQAAQQALIQQANQAVQEALRAQAPVVGLDARFRGARWVRVP